MTYPHRPPPPYRSGMIVEAARAETSHRVVDPFWLGFKLASGVLCALFLAATGAFIGSAILVGIAQGLAER